MNYQLRIILFLAVLLAACSIKIAPRVIYAVGEPAQLRLKEGGRVIDLEVQTHPLDYEVSPNCRLIISTNLDDRGEGFVQITDPDGKLNAVHLAATFFMNPDVFYFSNPSFAPDNTSYFVMGHTLDQNYFYLSDGKTRGDAVYELGLNWVITQVRWKNSAEVGLQLIDGEGVVKYLLASRVKTVAVSQNDFLGYTPPTGTFTGELPPNVVGRPLICTPKL